MKPPVLLYCHCQYAQVLPEAVKKATLKCLSDSGQPFEAVPDLCELSARRDPALARMAAAGPVKIAACFPRAVKWLFHSAGAPLSAEQTEIVNLRTLTAEEAGAAMLRAELTPNLPAGKITPRGCSRAQHPLNPVALRDQTVRVVLYEGPGSTTLGDEERLQVISALLERGFAVTKAGAERPVAPPDSNPVVALGRFSASVPPDDEKVRWLALSSENEPGTLPFEPLSALRTALGAPESGTWKPWFPVIDYDRCTNCMQCLSFCLFGVYGVDDEKRIQVQNQDHCKTNCPACSRVCPEAAIMFPKYKAGPINGDVVSESDLDREKMKIDISALLGGDVYAMLRTRSQRAQTRFSKERDADKALAERQKCLVKLGSIVNDVPPEVLLSLPSPEEIARKAEAAAAKAKAALESPAS